MPLSPLNKCGLYIIKPVMLLSDVKQALSWRSNLLESFEGELTSNEFKQKLMETDQDGINLRML
ncbi:MAG: hypothetical protein ISR69_09365 [Gammaproteobacteria bacterium]|nr:hypothetical protein [Gammaproteobacteria bacterium]